MLAFQLWIKASTRTAGPAGSSRHAHSEGDPQALAADAQAHVHQEERQRTFADPDIPGAVKSQFKAASPSYHEEGMHYQQYTGINSHAPVKREGEVKAEVPVQST